MKKIIFALSLLLLCSCSYLDVVPEGKATEEDIWKTEEQAENYRYYMQTYMPNLIGYDWSPDQFAGDDFITGARGTTYYFSSKSLLYGEENANLTYFGRWAPNCTSGGTNYDIYRGIRYCFYLLDNIYKVPAVSQENADRYAGEAWFLVGYYHQCLLEYYGPIVLVKKFIPIDAPESEILTPRTPYDECVKYIAECYDRAAGLLPDVVGESELGLPTKMAALSYKARLLLYAASPLVNGNSEFYADFVNKDGTHLINQTYDAEKWKRAMDAAKEAIDCVEASKETGAYTMDDRQLGLSVSKSTVRTGARQLHLHLHRRRQRDTVLEPERVPDEPEQVRLDHLHAEAVRLPPGQQLHEGVGRLPRLFVPDVRGRPDVLHPERTSVGGRPRDEGHRPAGLQQGGRDGRDAPPQGAALLCVGGL